jgi:hypothetical protein
MLVKYLYSYGKGSDLAYARLDQYKILDSHAGYGIVFGRLVEKPIGRDDTYDIPLSQVVAYMQGGRLPEFPALIPGNDSELVVDLVSSTWETFTCALDEKTRSYNYSKDPGDLIVSGFSGFFNDGFWYRASDLNLNYSENQADRILMEKYVHEYGKIYLEYIAANRERFADIPEEWLVLGERTTG